MKNRNTYNNNFDILDPDYDNTNDVYMPQESNTQHSGVIPLPPKHYSVCAKDYNVLDS